MKKVVFCLLFISLILFVVYGVIYPRDGGNVKQNYVIINQKYFEDIKLRQGVISAISGGDVDDGGKMPIKLYTRGKTSESYRNILSALEKGGWKVTLKKIDDGGFFDLRANGGLEIYIFEGSEQQFFQAFISENSEFFSTGFVNEDYDRAYHDGDFASCREILQKQAAFATIG